MKKSAFLVILILSVLCISTPVFASGLKVHFVDVGEGDSILIETPKGRGVLIDAGNLISGFRVVKYIRQNNISGLDRLIFTHPHLDHIGGAFFVLQMLDVKSVYDNGQDLKNVASSSDLYRWYIDLVRRRHNYRPLKTGNRFSVDGVFFKVLWPHKTPVSLDFNANTLVIMVEYKNRRILLTGDLTIIGEQELLKKTKNLKADILKVGHHGAGSTSGEFLKVVLPEVSIISVNKDNIRGYPSSETLVRLEDSGSRIYRTDLHGDIIINVTEAGELKVITSSK